MNESECTHSRLKRILEENRVPTLTPEPQHDVLCACARDQHSYYAYYNVAVPHIPPAPLPVDLPARLRLLIKDITIRNTEQLHDIVV